MSCHPSAGCPVSDQISSEGCSRSAPPLVDHAARINMPVVENATSRSQSSQLDTSRQKSSIPIAAGELPKHQENGTDVWMYPSEQQFYNAMTRKVGTSWQRWQEAQRLQADSLSQTKSFVCCSASGHNLCLPCYRAHHALCDVVH